jgi:1,4-dihydroxy-2-naphthoate octaprenyltransferase
VTVVAGVAISVPFIALLLLWGFGALPAAALLPLLTAPLAVRLGEVLSPRSAAPRRVALREAAAFALAFGALLVLGLSLPVGAS